MWALGVGVEVKAASCATEANQALGTEMGKEGAGPDVWLRAGE